MTEELNQAAGAQEATPVAETAKAETVKEAPATFRFVIGEKVGMTQLFDEKGNLHGGSVVKAGPCKVVRVRTQEKDGYNAVCVGFGEVKETKLNKPELGYFKKASVTRQTHEEMPCCRRERF
jgi:large subunit ribosomal protein L3